MEEFCQLWAHAQALGWQFTVVVLQSNPVKKFQLKAQNPLFLEDLNPDQQISFLLGGLEIVLPSTWNENLALFQGDSAQQALLASPSCLRIQRFLSVWLNRISEGSPGWMLRIRSLGPSCPGCECESHLPHHQPYMIMVEPPEDAEFSECVQDFRPEEYNLNFGQIALILPDYFWLIFPE